MNYELYKQHRYFSIIEKLLNEVDDDIKEIFLKEEYVYKGYQLIDNPCLVILQWQGLRDKNKK
jgi:hypothetical protein